KSVNRTGSALAQDDDLVRRRIIQQATDLFVQHVAIERTVVKQLHPAFDLGSFAGKFCELRMLSLNFACQNIFGIDAVIAMIGMEAEIAEHDGAQRRHDQSSRISLLVLACPHGSVLRLLFGPEALNRALRTG